MRKLLTALPVLLLTGCINDSATYYADSTQEHTLTLRRQQDYFWSEEARYTLMAARMPDCQRQFALGQYPLEDAEFELYNGGDNHWSLKSGKHVWQVETQSCALLPPAGAATGTKIGVYRADGDKLVFEEEQAAPAPATPASAAAPAPTPADN
jgi:hypothetical protein